MRKQGVLMQAATVQLQATSHSGSVDSAETGMATIMAKPLSAGPRILQFVYRSRPSLCVRGRRGTRHFSTSGRSVKQRCYDMSTLYVSGWLHGRRLTYESPVHYDAFYVATKEGKEHKTPCLVAVP